MRIGLDQATGAVLTDWAECTQSLGLIATTAVATIPLARNFGLKETAQDKPFNRDTILSHFSAIAGAVRKWEPGFRLTKIAVIPSLSDGARGVAGFMLTGDFFPNGHLGDYSRVMRGVTARALL